MAQVPGLGLDQSQLADIINQQYKGYSQKQRNQMMQSAAATPDNWGAITQQANKTATQPTEFLGAGRTDNIPTVSQNGQQLTGYDDSNLGSLYSMNSGYKDTPFDYTDSSGKGYYTPETSNRIESSAPNFLSGWFGAYNNPSGNYHEHRPINAGGYYFADPWGFSHSVAKAGPNKYFVSESTINEHTRSGTADTWFSLNPNADLSGLQYGQYQGQNGLFYDPMKTNLSSLLLPGRINDAYAEKKSGGLLGGLNDLAEGIAKWTDPVFYKSMGGGTDKSLWKDLTNEGLYGAVFNKLDPILDKIDPGHNWTQDQIAGLIGADTQKEAFNQIAPIVLAAVSYGVGGTAGNVINAATTANAVNSGDWVGAATGALNAAGINPTNSAANYLKDAGFSPAAARMMSGIGAGTLTNLARGQDAKSALAGALFSGISGEAGRGVSQLLGPQLGEIGSKIVGGAAGGGLNSLFNQNSPVQGSLYGAMSGGLHGFLNSTDKQNNTFNKERDIQNRRQAQNLTKLAKLFVKK